MNENNFIITKQHLSKIYKVLSIISARKSRTEIIYESSLSWNLATPLLKSLCEKGLILKVNEFSRGRNDINVSMYVRTDKGSEFINFYNKLLEMIQ